MRPKTNSFACWTEPEPAHMDRFAPLVSAMLQGVLHGWRDKGLVELVDNNGTAVWAATKEMHKRVMAEEVLLVTNLGDK
jgi:hypothetical protein